MIDIFGILMLIMQELEIAAETGLKRAGRLRQALLRKAFEGRLVS